MRRLRLSVFPVRGLMAVYVFTTGLYGAVTLCGDERRGLFLPLPGRIGGACRFASLAAPVACRDLRPGGPWLSQTCGAHGERGDDWGSLCAGCRGFSCALKGVFRIRAGDLLSDPVFHHRKPGVLPGISGRGRLVPEVRRQAALFCPIIT